MEQRDLTNGAEKRDFFISYTKTDKAWAVWIADVLKRNGYSVYVQALDIRPGDDFLEKMENFLKTPGISLRYGRRAIANRNIA